ncbi:MAG: DUF459 domain-containing protein [Spirochaetales bacterium]|nr:DUF459 domain-containing protein [Spirochaetales bacterium]
MPELNIIARLSRTRGILTIFLFLLILFRAGAIDDKKISGLFYTADKAYAEGLWGKALLYYTIIVDLDPDNTTAHYKRGLAYRRIENFEDALIDFRKVLSLDKRYKDAEIELIVCLIRTKKLDEALAYAEKTGFSGQPPDVIRALKAEIYFMHGETQRAKIIMNAVLSMNPRYFNDVRVKYGFDLHGLPFISKFSFSEETPLEALFIGDSMAGGSIYFQLKSELKNYRSLNFTFHYKTSSGLTRPDFYNWPYYVTEFLAEKNYRVVFIFMGTNDAQNCVSGGRVYTFGTDDWFSIYEQRVDNFLSLLESHVDFVFWIGLPPMGRPGFNERIESLNAVYEKVCLRRKNSIYINTKPMYLDEDGKLKKTITINGKRWKARIRDGVHLTMKGVMPIVDEIFSLLQGRYYIRKYE